MLMGDTDPWDLAVFKGNFSLDVIHLDDEKVEFVMKGICIPIANALRRILIAEVPTVAIHDVTIYQNTGVVHDENLCSRLGLVPIDCDPDLFQYKEVEAEFSQENNIQFKLHKTCQQGQDPVKVYSGDLVWTPEDDRQAARMVNRPPRPVVDDLLLAILAPGQELELTCRCEKGIGKEHTKWSPVCTAYYRLVLNIELTQPICGEDAERLRDACPKGVIDLVPGKKGKKRAVVADATKFNVHRQVLEPFADLGVKCSTSSDHFFFSIESTGSIPAPALFDLALVKLRQKCTDAKKHMAESDEYEKGSAS